MVDTQNKLNVFSTGNAVLFTPGIPSPVDLSVSDENHQSDQFGAPILITRPKTLIEENTTTAVNGGVDTEVVCNGEELDLHPNRSEACMMRVKQDWCVVIKHNINGPV